ncbi:MAG TPA: hypothetical protein VF498_17045, partial [Anaerolineales bacterium]
MQRRQAGRPGYEQAALGFLLGSGLFSLAVFYLSLLGVSRPLRIGGGLAAVSTLAAAAWGVKRYTPPFRTLFPKNRKVEPVRWQIYPPIHILEGNGNGKHPKHAAEPQSSPPAPPPRSRLLERLGLPARPAGTRSFQRSVIALLAGLLVLETAVMVWRILTTGLGWDGTFVYALKAKIFFASGGVSLGYFSDLSRQWSHPDYPLLLPLNEAWLFTWLGRVAEGAALKILFAVFFACLAALFYRAVRRRRSAIYSLVFSLLLTGLPALLPAAQSGYADLPLSAFALGSSAALYFWLEEGRASDLVLGGILAALCIWVKREGAVLWGIDLAALVGWALGPGRGLPRRARLMTIARFALPGLLLAPWFIFSAQAALPGKDFLPAGLAALHTGLSRLPELARLVLGELFAPASWGLLWGLFLLAALNPRRLTTGE